MAVDYHQASAGLVALGALMSLVKLWMRLRFRLRKEQERRSYLLAASALPAGSEVHEQRQDGSHFTLTVGDPARDEHR